MSPLPSPVPTIGTLNRSLGAHICTVDTSINFRNEDKIPPLTAYHILYYVFLWAQVRVPAWMPARRGRKSPASRTRSLLRPGWRLRPTAAHATTAVVTGGGLARWRRPRPPPPPRLTRERDLPVAARRLHPPPATPTVCGLSADRRRRRAACRAARRARRVAGACARLRRVRGAGASGHQQIPRPAPGLRHRAARRRTPGPNPRSRACVSARRPRRPRRGLERPRTRGLATASRTRERHASLLPPQRRPPRRRGGRERLETAAATPLGATTLRGHPLGVTAAPRLSRDTPPSASLADDVAALVGLRSAPPRTPARGHTSSLSDFDFRRITRAVVLAKRLRRLLACARRDTRATRH